tara:strand:+ start:94 stop:771 length:678 start_codon:yes stop_codon:yes gene_type:complete
MAINDPEFDQKLKEQMNAIELGDDLILDDPEEYEDEGGLRSLKNRKMASETPEEEFELELGGMLEEFKDAVKNGYKGTIEDYSKEYFGKKEKAPSIKLASGYKLNDFELNKSVYDSFGLKLYNLIDDPEMGSFREDEVREMLYDGQYAMGGRVNYNQGTPKQEIVAPSRSMQMDTTTGQGANIYNEELINRPTTDPEMIRKLRLMIQKAKEDKLKRAKGGIAGVL